MGPTRGDGYPAGVDEFALTCESTEKDGNDIHERVRRVMAHTIRFGLRSSQHNRSWSEIKENFLAAEEWGFESAWVFDHIVSLGGDPNGPTLEAWTLLAGLAEATNRVEIGPMVTGITYRNPGMLLKNVVTVDHISNGRALLGLGAAWHEDEHRMYDIHFPGPGARVSMFHEALQMFRMLQSQDVSSFDGKHYHLRDAIFEPKPVRNPIPFVLAGSQPRMLRIIAEFADQWDNNFRDLDEYRDRVARLEAACREIGRDPAEIRRSTTLSPGNFADEKELRGRLQELRDAGVTDFLFHVPDNLDDMRHLAESTIPELRQTWASGGTAI